jgi:hypothetical protein
MKAHVDFRTDHLFVDGQDLGIPHDLQMIDYDHFAAKTTIDNKVYFVLFDTTFQNVVQFEIVTKVVDQGRQTVDDWKN